MTQQERPRRERRSSSEKASPRPGAWEEFCAGFDRCFGRVYAYVSRSTTDRESRERIVSAVLEANLDLLIERGDELHEIGRLKADSDRLVGAERAKRIPAGAIDA